MALVPRCSAIRDPMDPLDRLDRYDRFDTWDRCDFWDRLRHWRALDYFDAMLPSFFQPPAARCHQIVRSKSLSQLNYCHEIVTKDGFKVVLDVHKFKPHEIEVRIVNDTIVVEGKQSESWDNHKTTTRSFAHRYTLPLGYDPWQVSAQLTPAGFLTIRAPPPAKGLAKCLKRYVPIKHI